MKTIPVLSLALLMVCNTTRADGPYQAMGFKVGEVTHDTAIVWTRLTKNPAPNPAGSPGFRLLYTDGTSEGLEAGAKKPVKEIQYPAGVTVNDIAFAAPGAPGQVHMRYAPTESLTGNEGPWVVTDWQDVDPDRDFIHQQKLTDLKPNTRYTLQVRGRSGRGVQPGPITTGSFKTAPAPDQAAPVVFTVSTGQAFNHRDRPDGYNIYPAMRKLDPSFFVHTGDIVYYDKLAKTLALARWHWQRTYSLPTNVDFHNNVASYFIKDDHDAHRNGAWAHMPDDRMFEFTWDQGLATFREQVPMGDKTYRTIRWGKDLQIWLVEGRDFRSPNTDPDGPNKTIWGAEQKAWFKRTVRESDAAFRVLISPTPVVGPDRDNKSDNHANLVFQHEGDELRAFIASQKNMVVVCGDRHWQYMSVHPTTGVREYSCGPASDIHAGGWSQEDDRPDYHKFLRVMGGFLSGTVDREGAKPTLTFKYHDVNGKVMYTDKLVVE
jgi:alkaline phosphatase D